jgi:glycosyltransferase involved in cell wall biosynthesis
MMPKVSVILPARNAEKTVYDACKSVLTQDFEDLELIVIVNGSSDKTEEVVKSINDKRIIITNSAPGIVPALNTGLRIAKGEIIARQDADDLWYEGKLSRQVSAFDENYADVVGTQMKIVQKNFSDTTTSYPLKHQEILQWFGQFKNPIGHPSVAFRRNIIDRVAGYWDYFPLAEDFDLWMRMLPFVRFANLDFVGVQYNFTPNQNYSHETPAMLIRHYAALYNQHHR